MRIAFQAAFSATTRRQAWSMSPGRGERAQPEQRGSPAEGPVPVPMSAGSSPPRLRGASGRKHGRQPGGGRAGRCRKPGWRGRQVVNARFGQRRIVGRTWKRPGADRLDPSGFASASRHPGSCSATSAGRGRRTARQSPRPVGAGGFCAAAMPRAPSRRDVLPPLRCPRGQSRGPSRGRPRATGRPRFNGAWGVGGDFPVFATWCAIGSLPACARGVLVALSATCWGECDAQDAGAAVAVSAVLGLGAATISSSR